MEIFDVAIAGGGPAGSTCAAFCAAAGLRALLLEREKFPREKVCGDCLNPSCGPVLRRLGIAESIGQLPHGILDAVEFIAVGGKKVIVDLTSGGEREIAIKRSLFDHLLMARARELGARIYQESTITALAGPATPYMNHVYDRCSNEHWKLETEKGESFSAHLLVAADGRNSTVARLCNLLPRPERERIALQAHIPLPKDFGNRVVLQFLRHGYSGQAPVNPNELNLCLVSKPSHMPALRRWAGEQFGLSQNQPWRTITPLTRAAIPPAYENLLLIGDAARVVEPFTGEGIYYALRSGELAANAIVKIVRGEDRQLALREFARAHAQMYRGRLWINRLARSAVLTPRFASLLFRFVPFHPASLRWLTRKIVEL
jgi:flavin-dependent dehydrogenase